MKKCVNQVSKKLSVLEEPTLHHRLYKSQSLNHIRSQLIHFATHAIFLLDLFLISLFHLCLGPESVSFVRVLYRRYLYISHNK